MAILLRPEVFLSQADLPRSTPSAARLGHLCDYMHAHLDAGLTLTDQNNFLAQLGWFSRRYNFRSWLRTFRGV